MAPACRVEWVLGGRIARVILDQPDRRNAFSTALAQDLAAAFDEIERSKRIRVIVLEGAGPAFCVGGNISDFADHLVEGTALAAVAKDMVLFNRIVTRMVQGSLPLVAALHGAVAGGGLALAGACDLRVCAPETVFRPGFIGIALPPDTGASWLLPRLIGHARASEFLLRNLRVDADTALAWGLVNQISEDPQEWALDVAQELAEGPPQAMAATRALLAQAASHDVVEQLRAEASEVVRALLAGEFEEGVRAFLEKRPPGFVP